MNKEYLIYDNSIHSLNVNNSGTLNKSNLQFAKRTMLFNALRPWSDELVKHKQKYPQNDISDVELELDFVIVDTNRYNYLLELEKSLTQAKEENKINIKP